MSRTRHAVMAVSAILFGILLFLGMAEIVCRLLPVNEGMRAVPVTAEQPVFHFEPNRKAVYAKGWDFSLVNRVRSNNYGFASDQAYDPASPLPLMALIGDSYVEALMVPYAETLQGRLAAQLGNTGRAYAFAASGAGMTQYLVWARYARDTFRPQAMTFVIIGNDFSESLAQRERSPGFHSFVRQDDNSARLELFPYRPSLIRRAMRHSALAMYLFSQAKIQTAFSMPLHLGEQDTRFVGNVSAHTDEQFLADSRWATDRFLDLLPEYSGLPRDRVLLVVDGVRPELYQPGGLDSVRDSHWFKMRSYVIEQARARGHEVIDLNPVFIDRFARDGKRFEYPTDGHWSGIGHQAAADAVMASRTYAATFGGR